MCVAQGRGYVAEGTVDVVEGTWESAVDAPLNSSFTALGISNEMRPELLPTASTMAKAIKIAVRMRDIDRNPSITYSNR